MTHPHHRGQHSNGSNKHRDRESGRRPGKRRSPACRRALRREVPSTVAVLVDETDFAAMREYPTFFPGEPGDHGAYLREMDGLLRSLAAQHVHIRVALFDPGDYAEFCEERHLDPDTPDSRTRYTAEVAALGATVPYRGESMTDLVPLLCEEVGRQRTWEHATGVLAAAGVCRECGRDLGRIAFEHACRALGGILDAAGPGVHHLVCSVTAEGTGLLATLHAEQAGNAQSTKRAERADDAGWNADGTADTTADPDGMESAARRDVTTGADVMDGADVMNGADVPVRVNGTADRGAADTVRLQEPDALVLCTVLAAGLATEGPGGLVLRSTGTACGTAVASATPDTVCGWRLHQGWLQPLSEAEVFDAYCTDPDTGEPIPPKSGLEYRAGARLPAPRSDHHCAPPRR